MDIDDDTHFCLKCKKTIVGLENYILHRRQLCMCLPASSSETSILSSTVTKNSRENPCIVHLTADHFFSSLELKSKTTVPKCSFGEASKNHKSTSLVDSSSTLSEHLLNRNDQELSVVFDATLDISNSSEDCHDNYYPPRSHTGGKWKPGTRPDIESRRQWDLHSCPPSPTEEIDNYEDNLVETKLGNHFNSTGKITVSDENVMHDENHLKEITKQKQSRKTKFNFDSTQKRTKITTRNATIKIQSVNDYKCDHCSKTFKNRLDFISYLLSNEHRQKFSHIDQWYKVIFCNQKHLIYSSLFQCLVCHYYFNNQNSFTSHLKVTHHIQKTAQLKRPLLCLSCNFECRGSDDLLNHINSKEHQNRIHSICHYHPIIIKEKLRYHACHYCSSKCQLDETRIVKKSPHLREKHNSKSKSKIKSNHHSLGNAELSKHNSKPCPHCNKSFTTAVTLKYHVILKHSEKCLKCVDCNLFYLTSSKLEKHFQSSQHKKILHSKKTNSNKEKKKSKDLFFDENHQQITKETFVQDDNKPECKKIFCPYCNKSCNKRHLKFHIFTHTGEKPFKCYMCNKSFAQKSTLDVHIKRHLGLKHLKCNKCDFRTLRQSTLLRHLETHKSDRTRSYLCDICGSTQLDKTAFKQHMRIHNKNNNYRCTYPGCHLTFRNVSESQNHFRVHTNERPYLCDVCGYNSKTAQQLKKHQRSHTGERPFQCKHCDYSAALSSHLLRHMRRHTGSKPYKCPYCLYTCNAQENIRKHILKTKKHAGKKMYPCKFCKFACNEFQEYREHLLQIHAEHFPNGEKELDSSVIAGLYVKESSKQMESNLEHNTFIRAKSVVTDSLKSNGKLKTVVKNPSFNETEKISEFKSKKQKTVIQNPPTERIKICPTSEKEYDHEADKIKTAEPALYIEVPTTNDISNIQVEDTISPKSNSVMHVTEQNVTDISDVLDALVTHTVSETYMYTNTSDDGNKTKILISGELSCVQNEMANVIDSSTLQLANTTDNNTDNTIYIYVPFTKL